MPTLTCQLASGGSVSTRYLSDTYSDTVTRSGMFCAMATVIDRCKTEGVVDVFQVVKALRVRKPGAVPTVVSTLVCNFVPFHRICVSIVAKL